MQENKGDKTGYLYVYTLGKENIVTFIPVGHGDPVIIQMYKRLFRKPMRAVLHDMIGTAAKCWEEQHVKQIEIFKLERKILEHKLGQYLRKFGET